MQHTQYQIVHFQKNGVKVEIIAIPGMVSKYREGLCSLEDAIIDGKIYTSASKGNIVSKTDLEKIGINGRELLELIMKTGKYGLTAQEKKDKIETKKLQVINFIHQNFIEPTTKKPHPVSRIESALQEIKAKYDIDKSAERIVRSLLPKLTTIIRLSEHQIECIIVIPNKWLGKIINVCYNMGNVLHQEYNPENVIVHISISPLMKTLEEKDYSKAIILCNIILERYPRNELVKEIKKYVELQIGQPDDDVPISANELEEAESFNAFEAEEYSEEESEEEEEEEIEEETEEEENQQTKYSPKQKHEGNERNQMTTQRKAQTKKC
ncbi:ribosome assembly factor SBDS [Histomonas meleagridis]|nr:ribosome assembly factor SBDS [Histomonas meleagridis]